MSFSLSLEHLFSMVLFLPTSISACDPSITPPDGGYIVYVPVTKEEKLTKKGLPRTVKTAQVRTSFSSEWSLDIQEDRSQAANVCLSQSLAVHLLAPHLPTQPGFYVKQRPQTEAEGAEWVPERFGYNNKICVFHLASPSLLFLLVSQEIQCSVGRLNAFEVLEEMDC